MNSFNKYKYIDFENLFNTNNYEFGSEIKDKKKIRIILLKKMINICLIMKKK